MWNEPFKFYKLDQRNEEIDNFIQEIQLGISYPTNTVFEWIPYNQFNYIKEINKDNFATVYLAIWKNGPLYWNAVKYIRNSNRTVIIKHLNNSQNITNDVLNEV